MGQVRRLALQVRRPGPGWGVAPFLESEFDLLPRCKMDGEVLAFQDLILDPAIARD